MVRVMLRVSVRARATPAATRRCLVRLRVRVRVRVRARATPAATRRCTSTAAHTTTYHYSVLLTTLTTHSSLLTPHSSLLTPHYSLHTAHHSPLTTHSSLLTTHYSLLTTHYLLLTTYYILRINREKDKGLAQIFTSLGNLYHDWGAAPATPRGTKDGSHDEHMRTALEHLHQAKIPNTPNAHAQLCAIVRSCPQLSNCPQLSYCPMAEAPNA